MTTDPLTTLRAQMQRDIDRLKDERRNWREIRARATKPEAQNTAHRAAAACTAMIHITTDHIEMIDTLIEEHAHAR